MKNALKISILISLLIVHYSGFSQYNKKKQQLSLGQNIVVGVLGGTNMSTVKVLDSYNVFESLYGEALPEKQYTESGENKQFHAGLLLQFGFLKYLKIAAQPAYFNQQYNYTTDYQWEGTSGSLLLNSTHKYTLSYFDVPLMLKAEFLKTVVSPYIQLGGYYSFMLDARKQTLQNITDISIAESKPIEFQNKALIHKKEFAKNVYGLIGGAGVNFDLRGIIIGFEANYRYGLSNIVNPVYRYDNTLDISQNYDLPDDISINNLSFSLLVIVPLVCEARDDL